MTITFETATGSGTAYVDAGGNQHYDALPFTMPFSRGGSSGGVRIQGQDLCLLMIHSYIPNGRWPGAGHPDTSPANVAWIAANSGHTFAGQGSAGGSIGSEWVPISDTITPTPGGSGSGSGFASYYMYERQTLYMKRATGTPGSASSEPDITVTALGDAIFNNPGTNAGNTRQTGFVLGYLSWWRGAKSLAGPVDVGWMRPKDTGFSTSPWTPPSVNSSTAGLGVIIATQTPRQNSIIATGAANGWSQFNSNNNPGRIISGHILTKILGSAGTYTGPGLAMTSGKDVMATTLALSELFGVLTHTGTDSPDCTAFTGIITDTTYSRHAALACPPSDFALDGSPSDYTITFTENTTGHAIPSGGGNLAAGPWVIGDMPPGTHVKYVITRTAGGPLSGDAIMRAIDLDGGQAWDVHVGCEQATWRRGKRTWSTSLASWT